MVGCHRSGTSAVTGSLVALGLHGVDPSDRMDNAVGNPEHWESQAACQYAEDILVGLGGAWDAPPAAADEPLVPLTDPDRRNVTDIFSAAYPDPGPLVWKDPRTCLLLPYWRTVLPGPLAAVFVWREPLAVSRSLHRRDGIALADGLALWERYNRSAAAGLQGVDTYVLDYAAAVADPAGSLGGLAAWLRGRNQFGPFADDWDLDAAIASIDPQLRHESGDDEGNGIPHDHLAVKDWLEASGGPHSPLVGMPPAASSPWPEVVLADRRQIAALRRDVDAARAVLSSTTWRMTTPLRTAADWMKGTLRGR